MRILFNNGTVVETQDVAIALSLIKGQELTVAKSSVPGGVKQRRAVKKGFRSAAWSAVEEAAILRVVQTCPKSKKGYIRKLAKNPVLRRRTLRAIQLRIWRMRKEFPTMTAA